MQVSQSIQQQIYSPSSDPARAAASRLEAEPPREAQPADAQDRSRRDPTHPPTPGARQAALASGHAQTGRHALASHSRSVRGGQTVRERRAADAASAGSANQTGRPQSGAPDVGPAQAFTIFGSGGASPPTANYSMAQRQAFAGAYADRVNTQIRNIESGSEAERNVKFLNARPFMSPSGYFSAGLLAAGYDPNQRVHVTLDSYVGMGSPEKKTSSEEHTYAAWQIAAGVLEHDRPASGGTLNFQSLHLSAADKARVEELQAIGRTLQDHWQREVAAPMQDAYGTLAARSGKADAYAVRTTLQSLQSDQAAFAHLSAEGQQAVNRTLREAGQVIIPNVYGYPIGGHAFIPYKPYDGNYENRPNQGLMIDLTHGTVSEIHGDKDFANWAQRNRADVRQSFNAADKQGGLDAHWPRADDVLDDLTAGRQVSYPGYRNLVSDMRIPVEQTFNYTRSRGSEYQLKYGNLTQTGGIASEYQALNAKDAKWADQTQVFGASQQNWKYAKDLWGRTFGFLPVAGNLGNIVFGANDSANGMTAEDRIGGNVAATISAIQLIHDGVSAAAGNSSPAMNPATTRGAAWQYHPEAGELRFRPAQPDAAASVSDGVRLTADNFKTTLPGLTPQGQENAARFLRDNGPNMPPLRNQQDIDNATRFFNNGGKLGLKGGSPDTPSPSPTQPGADSAAPGDSGPPSPLMPGLDYDAPLTPGQQAIYEHIVAELQNGGTHENPAGGASDAPPAPAQPRTDSGAGQRPPQPGPSSNATPGSHDPAELAAWLNAHPQARTEDIARHFGISETSVNEARHALDLPGPSGSTPASRPPGAVNTVQRRRQGIRLTDAEREKIIAYVIRHDNEESTSIAKRFDVTDTTIGNIRKKLGMARPRGVTPEKVAEILDYMRSHPQATEREIARQVHVSPPVVNDIRHVFGLEKTRARGLRISPEKRARLLAYLIEHPNERKNSIAMRFDVTPSFVDRMRSRIRAVVRQAPVPTAQPRPAGQLMPAVDNRAIIDWMSNNLSLETLAHLITLSPEEFAFEVELVRQYLEGERHA